MAINNKYKTSKFEHAHLASAVIWWLNYITAVGRDYILGENSIKIPASEYLERFYRDNIILEYPHPQLSQRRIDVFFKNDITKFDNAFELKFIKDDSTRPLPERKRIFNDLMRLRLFIDNNESDGFFMIAGKQMDFNTSFKKLNLNPSFDQILSKKGYDSFYSKWFSFDIKNPIKNIDFSSLNGDYKKAYTAFFIDYEKNFEKTDFENAKQIKSINTKLIFISEELSQTDIPQNFQIGIWQILV